jgi:hypothetical protein
VWFSIQIQTTWSYRAGAGPAPPHGPAGAGAVVVVGDGTPVLEDVATVVDGGDGDRDDGAGT